MNGVDQVGDIVMVDRMAEKGSEKVELIKKWL